MLVKHNGHRIILYSSIQDLPAYRFLLYNLYTMIDSGIGSDVSSFDNRVNNVRRLMISDLDGADKELANIQQNLRFIVSKTSPKLSSFTVLIKSINDIEVTDDMLTEDGINDIIARINKTRQSLTCSFLHYRAQQTQKSFTRS